MDPNKEKIEFHDKFSESIRNLIYYKTWVYKGKPQNVHMDFGNVAFFGNSIDKKWFMTPTEKADLIQNFLLELTIMNTF